ncbi:MAG: cob(I)yrinic acid a,c-diamide adenosyltransferase [Anaerolineales bacterium]|nr:cob(I)yrinic acid a,c-diamide adenosyltransferase [Anaerolineales bacterium]
MAETEPVAARLLRGDSGLTDLIDARDLPKHDQRFEVLGALDEASSALGVARAVSTRSETRALLLDIQRDLCWMMSELAVARPALARAPAYITPERLHALEQAFDALAAAYPSPPAFTVPGDSLVGALLHLARSIVRRAERHVTRLAHAAPLPNPHILPYLNRLSTLVFVLARAEEAEAGLAAPTLAHGTRGGL